MKRLFAGILLIGLVIILLFVFSNQFLICNAPYMRVGDICCLDANNNGICDENDPTTTIETTTTTTTLTTSTTTTTTATTSTINILPECYQNFDCGINGTEIIRNYTCSQNNINRQYVVYRCVNPGTPHAKCIGTEKWEIIKSCEGYEKCAEGKEVCEPKL